jgi:hypothetical protein
MSYDVARALDTKSQTAFAVTIICGLFIGETLQVTRLEPQPATAVILSLLGIVGVVSVGVGIHFYRRARRARID